MAHIAKERGWTASREGSGHGVHLFIGAHGLFYRIELPEDLALGFNHDHACRVAGLEAFHNRHAHLVSALSHYPQEGNGCGNKDPIGNRNVHFTPWSG
jgi:hypothetical protein